mgnify:CR=1 FL=1|jgi:UDPglucose 6-dehydrogenase
MIIGILGCGTVGTANKKVFKKFDFAVRVHDIKFKTEINNLLACDLIVVCLPTPTMHDGTCDTRLIVKYLQYLHKEKYKGIVLIRSTVLPGVTHEMQKKFKGLEICYSPEFLRDRSAYKDLLNSDFLPIGTNNKKTFKIVKKIHSQFVKKIIQTSTSEAELIKYMNNIIACNKVVFANIVSNIAQKKNCNYKTVKQGLVNLGRVTDNYLDMGKNHKGYNGACLPKDIKSFVRFCKKEKFKFNLFDAIIKDNKKFI